MNEKDKKYNPSDKFNWGSGDFAVVLEPHETKGLSDRDATHGRKREGSEEVRD